MPKTNKDIEAQILKAVESLSEQTKPNVSKTAREFGVPEGRLGRRWKGGKSLFQRQPNGRKLNSAQEKALCEYIDHFDAVGAPISHRQIAIAADAILENDHTDPTIDPPRIGDHWIERFLKRNPQFSERPRRALDFERATPLDVERATPLDVERASPLDVERASPLDVERASPLDVERATPLDIERAAALDETVAERWLNDHARRFKEGLAKLAKGAEAQALLARQLQRELDQAQAIMSARHARCDNSRRHLRTAGITNSSQAKVIKRKEYKLTEKADQEKTKRKWKKVFVEIRKHGRTKKRS